VPRGCAPHARWAAVAHQGARGPCRGRAPCGPRRRSPSPWRQARPPHPRLRRASSRAGGPPPRTGWWPAGTACAQARVSRRKPPERARTRTGGGGASGRAHLAVDREQHVKLDVLQARVGESVLDARHLWRSQSKRRDGGAQLRRRRRRGLNAQARAPRAHAARTQQRGDVGGGRAAEDERGAVRGGHEDAQLRPKRRHRSTQGAEKGAGRAARGARRARRREAGRRLSQGPRLQAKRDGARVVESGRVCLAFTQRIASHSSSHPK